MRCVICRQADTQEGTTTATLERGAMTLVVKDVPARVCPNCGEEYVDESTAARLIALADEADHAGVQVDVRRYVAA